jgi:hypothetical protein
MDSAQCGTRLQRGGSDFCLCSTYWYCSASQIYRLINLFFLLTGCALLFLPLQDCLQDLVYLKSR